MKKPEVPTRESIAYGLQLNLIGEASQKKRAHKSSKTAGPRGLAQAPAQCDITALQ